MGEHAAARPPANAVPGTALPFAEGSPGAALPFVAVALPSAAAVPGTALPIGAVAPPFADVARAAAWLGGHGYRGRYPPPLLTARLRARRRSGIGWVCALVVVFVGTVTVTEIIRDADQVYRPGLIGIALVYVFTAGARLAWLGSGHGADRAIGSMLVRRVTHPVRAGWRDLVGPGYTVLSVLLYGVPMAIGLAGVVRADTPADRYVGIILTSASALLAGIAVLSVADVARRPAVAEDGFTLWADDMLRREDAKQAVASPLAGGLAIIVEIDVSPWSLYFTVPVVLVAVALGAWVRWARPR